jgi:transposase
MRDVDPASPEFEVLPPQDRAIIYRQIGWTIEAVADELDVSESTVKRWTSPKTAELHREKERLRQRSKRTDIRAPRLTYTQKQELKQLYKDGARDVDLAAWFGVSEATVRGHTKDFRRPNPLRTIDRGRVRRLREQGMTIQAISRRLGIGDKAASRVLKEIREAAE